MRRVGKLYLKRSTTAWCRKWDATKGDRALCGVFGSYEKIQEEFHEVHVYFTACNPDIAPKLAGLVAPEKTKEYLSNKGVKARAMDGRFVAALIAAGNACNKTVEASNQCGH